MNSIQLEVNAQVRFEHQRIVYDLMTERLKPVDFPAPLFKYEVVETHQHFTLCLLQGNRELSTPIASINKEDGRCYDFKFLYHAFLPIKYMSAITEAVIDFAGKYSDRDFIPVLTYRE